MHIENKTENIKDFTGEVWFLSEIDTLVDAGTGDSWKEISEIDNIDTVLVTHSHYDHVDNLKKVVDKYRPKIYAHNPENLEVEAEKVSDGEFIDLDGFKVEVFHTPGHKNDSVCFYIESEKMLFAGDLLFPEGGFGRTDLDEGDRDQLIKSIEKIAELDVEKMYTGHGEAVQKNANNQIKKSLREARKHESKY